MAHEVTGYVRNKTTGAPSPNVPVSIYQDIPGGSLIPVAGAFGGSTNPTQTDANGFFSWTCELSPGPIKLNAESVTGDEVKIRSGKELMQAGTMFVGDLPGIIQSLSDGVLLGYGESFLVEAVTGQRRIRVNGPSAALAAGNFFSIDADRTIDVTANPSLPTRRDIVVLQQWVGTNLVGKQAITLLPGLVNNTDPVLNANADILEIPLARVMVPQNATSVTVEDMREYVGPTALPDDIVGLDNLKDEVLTLFEGAAVDKFGATVNFLGSSELTVLSTNPGPFTLATYTLTLPPGKWLIRVDVDVHNCRCTTSSGIVRFTLEGTGTPQAPDHTTRPIRFSGNVFRGASFSSILIVTPAVSTAYVITAKATYESGDPVVLGGGSMKVMAY